MLCHLPKESCKKMFRIISVLFAIASLAGSAMLVRASPIGAVASGGYRLLLAVPMLYVFSVYLSRKHSLQRGFNFRRGIVFAILAGICFGLDLTLFNLSLRKTTAAEANLLTNLVPFVIAPISVIFFKQKISLKFIIPCGLALFALILMNHGDFSLAHTQGNLLSMSSMIFYAMYWLCIDVASKYIDSGKMMTIVSLCGGITLFIVAMILHEKLIPSGWNGWLWMIMIAFTGQISGQLIITASVKHLSVELSTFLLLTQSLFAGIFAYFFFDEKLTMFQLIGGSILLYSIYLAKRILSARVAS